MFDITILTPTYNRANELHRLADSLCAQTNQNFQWLIIDDGSTDDTEQYIKSLSASNLKFTIEYHKKKNGGKHTAINYSHPFIDGEFTFIVDSDDYLLPDSIQIAIDTIETYKNNPQIGCLTFLRGYTNLEPINKSFPPETTISNHIDFRLNKKRLGDCAEIVRTSALREIPFPEFDGEKFMSEGYLWVNLSLLYDTVYINKVIYICEYLENGLTNSGRKMRARYPYGGMANSNNFLKASKIRKLNFRLICIEMLLYIIYGKIAHLSFSTLYHECHRKNLFTVMYPLGLIMYNYWKKYITIK